MAIDLKRITEGKLKREPRVLIFSADGVGKAQPLDAQILTPHGFVTMGEIAVGDEVIGADGRPKTVVGVFPQGQKKVFRVTMNDGAETECCAEHLWATTTVDDVGSKPVVRSLAEIQETMFYRKGSDNPRTPNDYPNHRVQLAAPIEFASSESLPLHPYLLGLLLGDAHLDGACIDFDKPETDLWDRIERILPEGDAITRFEVRAIIRRKKRNNQPSDTRIALEKIGLYGTRSTTKFIPRPYLFADEKSRLELLRGLCDTDGHVIHSGQRVEVPTSSSQLCDGIMFLVRSLGGTITLREKQPKYTYRGEKRTGATSYRMLMYFPNGICPVSSVKHLGKWREKPQPYYRSIAEIEEVGVKECQCISIDSPDGLYVTDDFIVTHNTQFAAGAPDPFFIDLNRGSLAYNVKRVIPESWSETMEYIDAVEKGVIKCKTLVIDSISDLEYMGHLEFFQGTTIDKWDSGFGHGDTFAFMKWRELLSALERVWNSGKTIILIGHMTVRTFADPQGASYDRYEVAVRKNIAGLLRQSMDYVLFAKEGVARQKVDGDMKAVATGARWIHTSRSPAYDAKSRGQTLFPDQIALSWSEFNRERMAEETRIEELNKEIATMLKEIGDKSLESAVQDWMRGNPGAIVETRNRVAARLEKFRAEKSAQPQQPNNA